MLTGGNLCAFLPFYSVNGRILSMICGGVYGVTIQTCLNCCCMADLVCRCRTAERADGVDSGNLCKNRR